MRYFLNNSLLDIFKDNQGAGHVVAVAYEGEPDAIEIFPGPGINTIYLYEKDLKAGGTIILESRGGKRGGTFFHSHSDAFHFNMPGMSQVAPIVNEDEGDTNLGATVLAAALLSESDEPSPVVPQDFVGGGGQFGGGGASSSWEESGTKEAPETVATESQERDAVKLDPVDTAFADSPSSDGGSCESSSSSSDSYSSDSSSSCDSSSSDSGASSSGD